MVSDWLKTQKKPPRTNQIRAVFTTKFEKKALGFSKRFDFACKTTIEKLKKYSKKPEHSKKYVFLAKCNENAALRENTIDKIEENEPEKLKKLLIYYAKVKNKEQKRWQTHSSHDCYTFQALKVAP